MKTEWHADSDTIQRAFALARDQKPAYADMFPFLEALFILQAEAAGSIRIAPPEPASHLVHTHWQEGFPLLKRWEFPLDLESAESILGKLKEHIPAANSQLAAAQGALVQALSHSPEQKRAIWESFMQHEWEPWDEWVDMSQTDMAPIVFLARSCIRPSIESTSQSLASRFPIPDSWLKGYCPICGSLPALLYLQEEGQRKAYCSWCSTHWGLHRLQCPQCDNRLHESLGYLFIEAESQYRIQYCRLCKTYFKLIDTREMLYPPLFPLEEWTTLHLDLLAQRSGWQQPPSPSAVVYGERSA